MSNKRFILSIAMLISLTLYGCGGGQSGDTQTSEIETQRPIANVEELKLPKSPPIIAGRVAKLYTQALGEVVSLLKDRPEGLTIKPELQAVKEKYVQQFVELGKAREALDAGGKQGVDMGISKGIAAAPSALYQAYRETHEHYRMDREVTHLIASFNIMRWGGDVFLRVSRSGNWEILPDSTEKEKN